MTPIRSQKLRDAAKDAPRCFACQSPNDGTVIGCHPNGLRYGKGMGQKPHDLLAYCCHSCHNLIDGRAGSLNRQERDEMWLDAFYWSTVWLIQSGRLA
jgi:hypothetical protein